MDSVIQEVAYNWGILFSPPGSYIHTKKAAGGTGGGAADDLM